MDRLTVTKSFVHVAKAKSLTGAARQLGISGSLVSRHIADLESRVGVRLVNRTARAVSLTEAGQRYLEFSERLLTLIEEEDAAVLGMRDAAEGQLSIVSPKWIGSLDVGDAVASFAQDYPGISVKFDVGGMSDRAYDFIENSYDLAFHTKNLRDSSVLVRKVATLDFVLCASPAYVEERGAVDSPVDLAKHACLVHSNDPVWHFTQGERSTHQKITSVAFSSNTYPILRKAALNDLGVALLPLRSVYGDLQAGRLVQVMPDYEVPDRPLFIVFPPGGQKIKKIQVFLDYMVAWFKRRPIPALAGPAAGSPAPAPAAPVRTGP
jgi:DNA-binding transcriptional LysR family regulator